MTLKQIFVAFGISALIWTTLTFIITFSRSTTDSSKTWDCLNEQAHALNSLKRQEPDKTWACDCKKKGMAKCSCSCIGSYYELIMEKPNE